MLNSRSLTLSLMYLATCYSLAAATPPGFETDVQPILQAKCVMCHGAAPQGKLDLRSQQAILNGGASGPVVVPGESAKSLLLTKVVTRQMPPGNVKNRRNQASRFCANRTMSDQSSLLAITPQIARTMMSISRCRVRPTTRGSRRERKCLRIEPTPVVAAMPFSMKPANL